MATFGSEALANLMPFGHGPNVVELVGGELFVTWFAGSYEGCEDQRIVGVVRGRDGSWENPRVAVSRFSFDGDTWIPEIGVPLPGDSGELRIVFWATPLSSFRLLDNTIRYRREGGWGGGSWFPFSTVETRERVWARDIPFSRVFISPLDSHGRAGEPELFTTESGLVVMGAARRLESGRWLVPYHTERKDAWFRSRFFVSDERQEQWETRGDIYAEPGCLEPVAVQLASGEIVCYMRHGGFDGHIWRAVSIDEARSFSAPERTNLRNPHAGIDVGLSRTSDRLLVIFNDSYRQRTPLSVGISEDGGATFAMRDLESGPGAFGYPKLLQTRDGLWHAFYSFDNTFIKHAWFDETWLQGGRKVLG